MDDRYAINAVKTEIREGYRLGDVQRILSSYLTGFGDLSDGFPSFGGDESKIVLEERLKQLFARYNAELVPVSMFINILGNRAYDCGWHELKLYSKVDASSKSIRTRYLEIWKKRSDGGWGIELFLDNLDQTPMLVEEMLQRLRTSDHDPIGDHSYRATNSSQSLCRMRSLKPRG